MEQRMCYGCMEPTDQNICPRCGYPANAGNLPHQLPQGSMLRDQYVIGKALGQGGFGITYLGWDRYLDRKVAVKEYYPNALVIRDSHNSTLVYCSTENMANHFRSGRERFLREAKTLAKFEEIPAIVSIKNFFEENNTAYIVMEYVKGTSLVRYVGLRGGKLSPDETFRLLYPVMDAMAKVHAAGMVHRDISPDNIILHPMGGAKLLDFGAAREVGVPRVDQALSQSTETILKHGFAPIEQYQSRGSLGPWTDVYALCATIWYCLTGTVPMDAPQRLLEGGAAGWDRIPDLSPQQSKVLEKGMSLQPKERYAGIGEFVEALMAAETPKVTVTPPAKAAEPEKSSVRTPQPEKKETSALTGDWYCQCGHKNKAWQVSCQSCGLHKPERPLAQPPVKKAPQKATVNAETGDWVCRYGHKNKAWHTTCQSCGQRKPEQPHAQPPAKAAEPEKSSVRTPQPEKKETSALTGDWYCQCGHKNKAWHESCQSCGLHKPERPLAQPPVKNAPQKATVNAETGDWICRYGHKNKAWHTTCQSCGQRKPEQPHAQPPAKAAEPEKSSVRTPQPEKKETSALTGDWYCQCGHKNKAWQVSCQNCGLHKPERPLTQPPVKNAPQKATVNAETGDWICRYGHKNKAWHTTCQSCGQRKPEQPHAQPPAKAAEPEKSSVRTPQPEKKETSALTGDWYCQCGHKNKAWQVSCQSCGHRR